MPDHRRRAHPLVVIGLRRRHHALAAITIAGKRGRGGDAFVRIREAEILDTVGQAAGRFEVGERAAAGQRAKDRRPIDDASKIIESYGARLSSLF